MPPSASQRPQSPFLKQKGAPAEAPSHLAGRTTPTRHPPLSRTLGPHRPCAAGSAQARALSSPLGDRVFYDAHHQLCAGSARKASALASFGSNRPAHASDQTCPGRLRPLPTAPPPPSFPPVAAADPSAPHPAPTRARPASTQGAWSTGTDKGRGIVRTGRATGGSGSGPISPDEAGTNATAPAHPPPVDRSLWRIHSAVRRPPSYPTSRPQGTGVHASSAAVPPPFPLAPRPGRSSSVRLPPPALPRVPYVEPDLPLKAAGSEHTQPEHRRLAGLTAPRRDLRNPAADRQAGLGPTPGQPISGLVDPAAARSQIRTGRCWTGWNLWGARQPQARGMFGSRLLRYRLAREKTLGQLLRRHHPVGGLHRGAAPTDVRRPRRPHASCLARSNRHSRRRAGSRSVCAGDPLPLTAVPDPSPRQRRKQRSLLKPVLDTHGDQAQASGGHPHHRASGQRTEYTLGPHSSRRLKSDASARQRGRSRRLAVA